MKDQLDAGFGVESERYPVFARIAETRSIPLYVLRDLAVRVLYGRPQLLDPLLERMVQPFHEAIYLLGSVWHTPPSPNC